MHQELYPHNTEIEELEPSSRSSWTDNNPSSPLFQNYVHFETLAQQYPTTNYKQLSNHQLHELVYCQDKVYDSYSKCYVNKFVSMVMDYNNLAYSKILELEKKEEKAEKKKNKRNREKKDSLSKSQSDSSILSNPNSSKIQQSINVFLDQAERILQYAASCGKLINRKLIISILNNQACYYQKLWELQKSCSYIEATILNMEQWGQESHWSELNPSPMSMSIQEQNMMQKISFKKQQKSSGDFSTKVQFKHDETLPEKLARNYELQNRFTPSYYYDRQVQYTDKKDIANHIAKMCELSMYYLQYCSLCGQLSNHQKAIEAAKKVISKMKKVIKINKYYYLNSKQNSEELKSEIVMEGEGIVLNLKRKKFIVGLSQIEEIGEKQILEEEIEKYRQTARFYLRERQKFIHQCLYKSEKETKNKVLVFHRINKTENLKIDSQFDEKFDDLSTEMEKIKYELKNFTIGNILQVKPKLYRFLHSDQLPKELSKSKIQYERHSFQNYEFSSPFSFQFIFTNALLLSTGYFTLATQLRLQAAKEEVIEGERFQTKLYKESEIYHLIAIIIISIYVPIEILYLKQLVTSYQNYYVKQISPIDEMQGNEYGNGPVSSLQNTKQTEILNYKFDKQKIYSYLEKTPESEEKKETDLKKHERKKTKKSKSKSKSSKSKSLKKGLNEYKGVKNAKRKQLEKLKSLKTSVKEKQEKRHSFNEEIPYISVSNRAKLGCTKKSASEKKNKMSRSILVKMQKSENHESYKYKQILNNISRSTNMVGDKSKSLSNRVKQHKNSSINSNYEKVSQFAKEKELIEKENFKEKRKKKPRCSSKELRIQHKKRSQYKLNNKSLKKEGSISKLASKSKSKDKSKAKDTSIPNFFPEQSKKHMGYKSTQYDQGAIKEKIHIIDQLNKKIESTRKREENIESYYDEKDTRRQLKLKKIKKNKNQVALSNSVSKKMGPYRTGKIVKESPKAPKIGKKVIPVI